MADAKWDQPATKSDPAAVSAAPKAEFDAALGATRIELGSKLDEFALALTKALERVEARFDDLEAKMDADTSRILNAIDAFVQS